MSEKEPNQLTLEVEVCSDCRFLGLTWSSFCDEPPDATEECFHPKAYDGLKYNPPRDLIGFNTSTKRPEWCPLGKWPVLIQLKSKKNEVK